MGRVKQIDDEAWKDWIPDLRERIVVCALSEAKAKCEFHTKISKQGYLERDYSVSTRR